MSLSPPLIWEPPSWDDEDVAPQKPDWDVGRTKPNIGTHQNTDYAMTITLITFGIVGIIVLLAVCIVNHINPVDLVCYIIRVIWNELVETACWYWMLLVKLVRWISCVKTERPAPQQPQESGIELRTSCPPPEDASFPPPREDSSHYQSSDSGLTTLGEESSASSAHTVVKSSADTAAASSAQTVVASA